MSRKSRMEKATKQATRAFIGFLLAGLLVNAAIFGIYFATQRNKPGDQQKTPTLPPYFQSEAEARPFPRTLDPGQFTQTALVQAYAAAKRVPGVLSQQPCYCGCKRRGHRSLLDCFTDLHATSCQICIKEALLVDRMTKEGKVASEIRTAIMNGAWETIRL